MRTVSPAVFASSSARTVTVRAVFQLLVLKITPLGFVEILAGAWICTFTGPCGRWPNCTLYVAAAPCSVTDNSRVTVAAPGLSVTPGGGPCTRMGPKETPPELPSTAKFVPTI